MSSLVSKNAAVYDWEDGAAEVGNAYYSPLEFADFVGNEWPVSQRNCCASLNKIPRRMLPDHDQFLEGFWLQMYSGVLSNTFDKSANYLSTRYNLTEIVT